MRSRQKIIDATVGLIEHGGFRAVSVAAVATRAGVSRQTVYSIFSTRAQLVSEALAQVGLAVGRELHGRVAAVTDPAEALAELIVAGRAAGGAHPALKVLIHADQGHPLFDEGMIEATKAVVVQVLPDQFSRDPALTARLDDVAEIVARLGISVVYFGSEATRSDDDLRAFLLRWLRPALAPPGQPPG